MANDRGRPSGGDARPAGGLRAHASAADGSRRGERRGVGGSKPERHRPPAPDAQDRGQPEPGLPAQEPQEGVRRSERPPGPALAYGRRGEAGRGDDVLAGERGQGGRGDAVRVRRRPAEIAFGRAGKRLLDAQHAHSARHHLSLARREGHPDRAREDPRTTRACPPGATTSTSSN